MHEPTVRRIPYLFSYRPWDSQNDVEQYEGNFVVLTKSRHHTPLIRTTSLSSQLTAASGMVPSGRGHEWSEDEDSPTGKVLLRFLELYIFEITFFARYRQKGQVQEAPRRRSPEHEHVSRSVETDARRFGYDEAGPVSLEGESRHDRRADEKAKR